MKEIINVVDALFQLLVFMFFLPIQLVAAAATILATLAAFGVFLGLLVVGFGVLSFLSLFF